MLHDPVRLSLLKLPSLPSRTHLPSRLQECAAWQHSASCLAVGNGRDTRGNRIDVVRCVDALSLHRVVYAMRSCSSPCPAPKAQPERKQTQAFLVLRVKNYLAPA
ncbi:hypothetical protein DOTSEDRAFT_75449 [Dothistroma septosporum NZE10]|uniref:Uncharacterized protein n=1 Tax=Dothistroma septosporum (strain NZE10 / CBS 128990) TaxID=675120 RepID=M2Y044_DOTSN|nr:hypothetical protein DOTSEDRAFT_75449 [Dothistroma septosporum NZE10]